MTTDRLGHWHRRVSSLRTRSLKVSKSSEPSSVDLTNDALELHERMLTELADAYAECDQLRTETRINFASWEQLFDEMPVACVVTDDTGQIRRANRVAGLLLNTAARHLRDRQLALFSRDRVAFAAATSRLRAGESSLQVQLALRPRDRRAVVLDAIVVASVEKASGSYLWFLAPCRERGREESLPYEHSHGNGKHDAPPDDVSKASVADVALASAADPARLLPD